MAFKLSLSCLICWCSLVSSYFLCCSSFLISALSFVSCSTSDSHFLLMLFFSYPKLLFILVRSTLYLFVCIVAAVFTFFSAFPAASAQVLFLMLSSLDVTRSMRWDTGSPLWGSLPVLPAPWDPSCYFCRTSPHPAQLLSHLLCQLCDVALLPLWCTWRSFIQLRWLLGF